MNNSIITTVSALFFCRNMIVKHETETNCRAQSYIPYGSRCFSKMACRGLSPCKIAIILRKREGTRGSHETDDVAKRIIPIANSIKRRGTATTLQVAP